MEKRMVGRTGIEVSVVGWGGEWVDGQPYETVKEVADTMTDGGVTLIDLFMPGEEVRTNIGRALAGRRQEMVIQGAIGSVDLNEKYDISRDLDVCKRYFENLLRCLGTDYIDFGMLFFMDSHEDIDAMLNNGVVEYARQLKQAGTIRAVGASVHNPETARRLVEEGIAEMLMFSINPAFDLMPGTGDIYAMLDDNFAGRAVSADPARTALYRLCESRGVGITVMKSLGAGKLLSPEHTPFTAPLTPVQCIQYALDRPAAASVLVGCRTREEALAAAAYATAGEEERNYTAAVSAFRAGGAEGFAGGCVYCNHCQPCPADIDIGTVNKYLDIARLDPQNVPPSIRQHYASLSARGTACVQCGSCEARCPFSVPVIENMAAAGEIFGE